MGLYRSHAVVRADWTKYIKFYDFLTLPHIRLDMLTGRITWNSTVINLVQTLEYNIGAFKYAHKSFWYDISFFVVNK